MLVGLAVASPAGPASAAVMDELIPSRLLVGLKAGASQTAVVAAIGDLALSSRLVPGMAAIAVEVPPEQRLEAGRRAAAAGARYAQPDAKAVAGTVAADPAKPGKLETVRVPGARTWSTGSPDVTVAVVDTGVNPSAQLPADRLLPGYDFVSSDPDAADEDNHGTLVAGIIAGQVCGECRILPVRVAAKRDTGRVSELASGIAWAADHGARVIVVSATTSFPGYMLEDAIKHAESQGALIVNASGSTGIVQPQYPGASSGSLAVSSVDNAGHKNSRTNENNAFYIDVAAVDNVNGLAGSSASAAIVAGTAALAFAAQPGATATEVKNAIVQGAIPSPERHYDPPVLDASYVLNRFGAADTVAPSVQATGLTDGRTTNEAVTVKPVATDDHAVARIEVLVDGTVVGEQRTPWAAEPIQIDAPAGFSGPRNVTVRAYDYAGNVGEKTTTITVDTVAPKVTIVSPQQNSTLRNPVNVVVTTDSDATRVLAGGVPMTRRPGTNTWTATIQVWPGGGGLFSVSAYDAAGNIGLVNYVGWADDAAPTARAISPATGTRVRGTFSTTITAADDLSGIAYAQLWANGKYVGKDAAAPYSLAVTTGATNGTVNLAWKLTDKAGNTRTYTRTVVADNKAPTVSISKAPKNKAKVKGTVKVYVKASDASGVARVELIVNGKVVAKDATAGYVLSVNTKKQKKTMKVRVRAYDKAGNVTYTTTRTWYRG